MLADPGSISHRQIGLNRRPLPAHMIHLQESPTPRKIFTAQHEGIKIALNDRLDHAMIRRLISS